MIEREPRLPTNAPIVLTARGFGRYFVVKNISKSGAGVEGEKPLRVGERVTLNYPTHRIDGEVRWTQAQTAGVLFHQPLDDDGLDALVQTH